MLAPSMTAAQDYDSTAAQDYDSQGHYYSSQEEYYQQKQRMKTAKRIGIGAGGGALAGGLIGVGTGALPGGGLGAGAGYLYNRHIKQRHWH